VIGSGADAAAKSRIARTSAPSSAHVKVIEEWNAFEAIAPAWDELVQATGGGPFSSYGGLSAWWRAFGQDMTLSILTLWRDGLLVGGLPLAAARSALSSRLRFLKVDRLHALANDYVGAIHCLTAPGHDDAARTMVNALADSSRPWQNAVLEPVAQSAMLDKIIEAAAERGLPTMVDTRFHSTVIDLSLGWESHLARRSRNFRKSLRTSQRRITEGKHRILQETSGSAEILERALALSARSWKGKAGTAFGVNPRAARYFRELWSSVGKSGGIATYLLEIDGKDVAAVSLLVHGNAAYGLICDFDEQYAHLSPGRFLVAHSIEASAAAGIGRYDMLRRTHYLEGFSDDSYPIRRVRLFRGKNWPYWVVRGETGLRPIGGAVWNRVRGAKTLRRNLKSSQ
jgi:CelD/BcsL family acetyltransferase involved in cellulose biosynthesis